MIEELSIPIPSSPPSVGFIHNYLGFGRVPSSCQVEIWNLGDEKAVILFTEIDHGTSVTNAAETLVQEIYKSDLKSIDKSKCLFLETYPHSDADIDQVVPIWDGDQVISVNWVHIGKRINQ